MRPHYGLYVIPSGDANRRQMQNAIPKAPMMRLDGHQDGDENWIESNFAYAMKNW